MVATKRITLNLQHDYVEFVGDSTETKPVEGIAPGSFFLEQDTGTLYYLQDDGTWAEYGGGD